MVLVLQTQCTLSQNAQFVYINIEGPFKRLISFPSKRENRSKLSVTSRHVPHIDALNHVFYRDAKVEKTNL